MEVGSIVHEKKKTRQKTRIKKTEREMQVSATSRHCEKNGWGGCLRKSENITKQVGQWEEAIESIPLAKLGDARGDVLLLWRSVREHQRHLSCLFWSFWTSAIVNKMYLSGVYEHVTFFILFNCHPGHNESRDSPCRGFLLACLMWKFDSSRCQSVDGSCNNSCMYGLFLRRSSCLDI